MEYFLKYWVVSNWVGVIVVKLINLNNIVKISNNVELWLYKRI